ncbi:tRNA pseudouridine(38-40) synthase TruA [Helicobacter sp. 12S02634-8]|uniref:tRNA pseudouridine(38-40) synthase TruA n=1 Tax=Helicobacter sp. 12S02634-8 TaxID=1476199 RepID=UPI000BA5ACE4|nr:tRNA pseudouridine(38-40) synthase TruA [Helicobacter sp. 12S02634-8]PAF48572.1 tRNA pseudouridine(38-40) synthase TruA [Helicobacter sp. 12S02634-8]
MKRLKAVIAYDGSVFSGFARQRRAGIMSVTEAIESVLKNIGIDDTIIGAGRTDKGVHASGQVISFKALTQIKTDKIRSLLNQKLYPHIYIKNLQEVPLDFHPRFDAKARGYRYIFGSQFINPFISKYISQEKFGDTMRIQEALKLFVGVHHFGYFKKQGSPTKSDVREILSARIYPHKIFSQTYQVIYLEGRGFLRSQVRLMVGIILAYSRGEVRLEDITLQLEGQKRVFSCPVSPNGLYLCRVVY